MSQINMVALKQHLVWQLVRDASARESEADGCLYCLTQGSTFCMDIVQGGRPAELMSAALMGKADSRRR
jgi:hypothetical protein